MNSVGRLRTAREGLKLLLSEDADEAKTLARQLNRLNQQRKDIETAILSSAVEQVKRMREERGGNLNSLVVSGTDWLEGVIGLTASKIVERYNLPTIILTTRDGITSRGSCRSIPALHMKNALDSMNDLFEQYGGHSQAAGLTMATKDIPELAARFDEYVSRNLRDEDFLPILNVDEIIHPAQISFDVAKEFDRFEPYGLGNPHPVLACKNVRGSSAKTMGRDNVHLSFDIDENIRAVAWNCGNLAPLVESEPIDLAYEPEVNEWQGELRIQCNVSSLEPTAAEGELFPGREELLDVYNFLRRINVSSNRFNLCALVRAFNSETGKNFSTYAFDGAINVFEELGLMTIDRDKKTFSMPRPKTKLDLRNSRTFRLGSEQKIFSPPATTAKIIPLTATAKLRFAK